MAHSVYYQFTIMVYIQYTIRVYYCAHSVYYPHLFTFNILPMLIKHNHC